MVEMTQVVDMEWQMAFFGPFLEIGPAPRGVMKALVAPGSLSEGSYSDGPSLEMS